MADAVFVLFLIVFVWMAMHFDDSDSGGRRARMPVR